MAIETEASDRFCCSECRVHLEIGSKIIYDEDGEYEYLQSYDFKYCPNCGARMMEVKENV